MENKIKKSFLTGIIVYYRSEERFLAVFFSDRGGLKVTQCNSWPKDAKGFKRRYKELPEEACNLMSQLCNKFALGIDLQHGILYLEKSDDLPLLRELIRCRLISPTGESCGTELRGKECRKYVINPYMFLQEDEAGG